MEIVVAFRLGERAKKNLVTEVSRLFLTSFAATHWKEQLGYNYEAVVANDNIEAPRIRFSNYWFLLPRASAI